jgi:hypothetical protein
MGSILGPMTIHSEELPHKDHILLDSARPQTGTSSRGAYGDDGYWHTLLCHACKLVKDVLSRSRMSIIHVDILTRNGSARSLRKRGQLS